MTSEVRTAVVAMMVAGALVFGIVKFQSHQLQSIRNQRRAEARAAAKAFVQTYLERRKQ